MVLLLSSTVSNYGPSIRNVSIIMIVLAGVAVALRFFARRLARQSITWDDWLMLMALPCSWLLSIDTILSVNFGNLGQHITTATPNTIVVFLKTLYASQFCYPAAITFIKFSIVAFYRRLFWPYMTKTRMYSLGAIIAIWLIVSIFTKIFACTPVDGYWHRNTVPPPRCVNEANMFMGLGIPNIIIDIPLLVFPLPPVWRLQVPTTQKLELTSIFAVTGFVLIISSLRLVAIVQFGTSLDVTWNGVPVAIFEVLEIGMAIILASIPSIVPLFKIIKGSRRKRGRRVSLGIASSAHPPRHSYSSWNRHAFDTNNLIRLNSEPSNEVRDEEATFNPNEAQVNSVDKEIIEQLDPVVLRAVLDATKLSNNREFESF